MAKKKRAAKTERAPRQPKTPQEIPALEDLRLAPNGMGGQDTKNRYINIEFANGYVVRLLPVGFAKGEAKKVRQTRDLISAWLRQRIGA